MVKYLGGLVVLAYAAMTFGGFEPFTTEQRGKLPSDARRGPGGAFFWTTGYWGGK